MTPRLSTITDIARFGAERFPDRVALDAVSGSGSLTYAQLWERAQRGAAALRSHGFAPGSRVLLTAPAAPDWLVAFFSILHADLVVVPIPDGIGAPLVAAVAAHTGARLRIAASGQSTVSGVASVTVEELTADGGGGEESGGVGDHSALREVGERSGGLGEQSALRTVRTVRTERLAILAFTSGSTARPRAVEISHANVVANLRALMAARQSEEPETVLSMLPPAHLYELVVGQLAPLVIGGRVVYAGALLPNRLVTAIRDHGITRALVVPALLDALCREVIAGLIDHAAVRPACQQSSPVSIAMKLAQYPAEERERIRRAVRVEIGQTFRAFGLGGAAIGSGWPDTLGLLGIGLDVGYGLTEAGPLVTLGWASECPPGSVGRPLPGVMVRIDQRGEVLVRSDGTMRGYFADTDATAAALEDGWLHTGDRGLLDAGGYLYILGRLKEAMVTAAGDTLHPEEIEPYYNSRFFSEHCVVPLRGSDGNDLPALVIVPQRPDMSDDEIDRVFGELRAAAPPRYRIATMVRRNEPLPRTLLGKLKRRELGQSLEIQRGPRVAAI
jgi:long-chain acyl-CoA synthetase